MIVQHSCRILHAWQISLFSCHSERCPAFLLEGNAHHSKETKREVRYIIAVVSAAALFRASNSAALSEPCFDWFHHFIIHGKTSYNAGYTTE